MKKYIKDGVIINEGATIVNGSTRIYNPTAEDYAAAGWVEYIEERTLAKAKAEKIAAINAYDTSSSVNGFKVNGNTMWLDKADRVGLMNSTTILKEGGETSCTLWFGGVQYTLTCDALISMLCAVEKYALECYNVTASHKVKVEALAYITDVDAFDESADYPEQLSFTI